MGVLNLTPDSFSDGGALDSVPAAVARARELVAAGADLLDVGGESTRPGATPVTATEELGRVLPVLEALRETGLGVPISIDTYKAEVAARALEAGAAIINDISGGVMDPGILAVAAGADVPLVLGHLRGTPATMMEKVAFRDVVREVGNELVDRLSLAERAGCKQLWVDPGLGFGKGTAENLTLLRDLGALRRRLGRPLVIGPSRKRFLGELTGQAPGAPAADRDLATAAAAVVCALAGADIVRVHDVASTRAALQIADAVARGS
jgi:dihydropteroate synthase